MFSKDALKKLADDFQTLDDRYRKLLLAFVQHDFKNDRAREYGNHGFPRRLSILLRCIQNVFALLPPERTDIPSREKCLDATINIHAFVFNVYGALDNLAWIWIQEKGLTRTDGKPIPDTWVGLGPENTCVRELLPPDLQTYLKGLNEWFEHLGNFRHSLAHRIPLYIPPYVIAAKDRDKYEGLERLKADTLKALNFAEHDRLSTEQMKLARFHPWMQHSFGEGSKIVFFPPSASRRL